MRKEIVLPTAAFTLATAGLCLIACTSNGSPIFMQLRWCVVEGSREAGDAEPGELITTHRLDGDALLRASEIWGEADIGFVSVIVERAGVKGVPVIRDPEQVQEPGELAGDIDATGGDTFESAQVALECHRAWRSLDPAMEGPVVVTARRFINAGLTLAGASQPTFGLWAEGASPLSGSRGDDLCGDPRQLLRQDVFEIDGSSTTHVDVGWLVISQPSQFDNLDHRARSLAHELGHILFLGHGNGADDNGDGEQAGVSGSRRFDQYCDYLGSTIVNNVSVPKEDLASTGTECKSIMHGNAACTGLTALQVEQARAAAAVMPGCNGACED